MSVLETLKAGLKSFTSRDPSNESEAQYSKTSFNLDAGADLLQRYQLIWKELHDNTEQNAKQAEEVDVLVNKLFVEYDRQNEVLGRLHEGAKALPLILSDLQNLTDVLAVLDEEYDRVEAALIQLENICEEQELQNAKLLDSQKLAAYRNRKMNELEKLKVQLAKEHVKKMQKVEKHKQIKLKERQEAFQDAFDQDVDYYRTHGRLERLSVSSSDSGKKADLGDIVVDSDPEGLDEFLNDTDTTPSAETVTQSTDKTEETVSDDEDPIIVRSTDDVDIEDEYYEDDLGASHGDQEQYVDSEDMTEESDIEKNNTRDTRE
ncbi:dysbindin-like isoform X2 [Saccostrea echinata]|uniref:dysbindin-like isoform X2 n=1 Tax=Saccostrea echinata TaxID=191078 RepID=UPI002A81FEB7|nr:dysbindin-like isoform X2 [Saccostrea echinata]